MKEGKVSDEGQSMINSLTDVVIQSADNTFWGREHGSQSIGKREEYWGIQESCVCTEEKDWGDNTGERQVGDRVKKMKEEKDQLEKECKKVKDNQTSLHALSFDEDTLYDPTSPVTSTATKETLSDPTSPVTSTPTEWCSGLHLAYYLNKENT